jgi:hypothetical protein
LRLRGKGRPDKGGMLVPPTGTARMASEFLHECLVPYLEGKGLLNEDTAECKLTADEGIAGCPDGGKREFTPVLGEYSLLWDGAPSHLPSTHTHVSAFHPRSSCFSPTQRDISESTPQLRCQSWCNG